MLLIAVLAMLNMATANTDTGLLGPESTSSYLQNDNAVIATTTVSVATGAPPPAMSTNAAIDGGPAPNCPTPAAWNQDDDPYYVESVTPGVLAAACGQRLNLPSYELVGIAYSNSNQAPNSTARLDISITTGIAGTRLRLPLISRCALGIDART